jgi:uncharacterized damage-inducible protein DinB
MSFLRQSKECPAGLIPAVIISKRTPPLAAAKASQDRALRKGAIVKTALLAMIFGALTLHAQTDPLEGQWQGYDGEWVHVSRQLVALAEAIPAGKFAWRPGPGVRSTSEVFMHIAMANFYLLSVTGPKMPADLVSLDMEKTVTAKADVIDWLKRSLEAVKTARAALKPGDLQRKVKIMDRDATVDGIYLRIIIHANEHMGQLVAYTRVNGIVPPWSESGGK